MTNLLEIEHSLSSLLSDSNSLTLATVNQQGDPEASYAPFIFIEDRFYVFLSDLASHTQNLRQKTQAGLVVCSPKTAKNPFVQQRLSCQCKAEVVPREEAKFNMVITQLRERFGNIVETLSELGDFYLFELEPIQGQFIAGFGQAYPLKWDQGRQLQDRIKP